ncbi:hypothetical protein BcepF1.103 [Burkholderia phage BcepF1]|uniref:Uncharacterized protein n=1 Tax=Burkholderia phage BcepF1 TaxID=2886897 RepID=A1Z007_9CAUD|nr:hypothetical protein BcepF1.103 [Burkholderia phage BcepF1]ABL96834.1 hypothetical protein BcepF1.103 [Burkholderia phage BcepF1]
MILELEGRNHNAIIVDISLFPALVGWEMQNEFKVFAASEDKAYRRAFLFEVLKYAKALKEGMEYELSTSALVENQLETWENIEAVFNGVLRANGIYPETHADNPSYWDKVGERVAISAMAYMGAISEAVASSAIQGE